MTWRTAKMCEDCPFADSGPGLRLRKSLRRGRWAEIIESLHNDAHFLCHKTTHATGNGSELICAGSIEYAIENDIPQSQLERIMERIDFIYARKRA